MDRKRFMMFNIAGGLTWGLSVTLLGYFLGNKIPNIDTYLLPIVLAAVILTTASPVLHILRDKKARTKISEAIKQKLAKKDKTKL